MSIVNNQNDQNPGDFGGNLEIQAKLFALESLENLEEIEAFSGAVREYQKYFVVYLIGMDDTQTIFKIPSLNAIEAVPVFLSEDVFLSFEKNYLKKHGLLDKIEKNGDILEIRSLSGHELFEILPKTALSSFFVLPSNESEFFLNFNMAKSFMECFHKIESEFDWDALIDEIKIDKTETINQAIEVCRKYRKMFDNNDWLILISQPTMNKLLKAEITRDTLKLDRYGDRRIFAFSDSQSLENFKIATNQTHIKLNNVKVPKKIIFGADLSDYEVIIINPKSPSATKIESENFEHLRDLFKASELEKKLFRINNLEIGFGQEYVDFKEFQNYIIPLDTRSNAVIFLPFNLPVYLMQNASGKTFFPVFTARDCFESFRLRLREKSEHNTTNFIEPHFITGANLFRKCGFIRNLNIIFNPKSIIDPISFEPSFALKVYCA